MTNTNEYGSLLVDRYRLDTMPHAQCHVRICRDKYGCAHEIELVSYETLVCVIRYEPTRDCYALYCTGTYSPTTRRHINRFTTEFCGANMYYKCRNSIGRNWANECGYYVEDLSTDFVIGAVENYYNGKPYYGKY